MFKRILVGFDGSEQATEALRAAAELSASLHARMTVACVIAPPRGETEEDRRRNLESDALPLRRALEDQLRAPACQAAHAETLVRYSRRVGDELVSIVEHQGFDLLVVGRHGREQAMHRGFGRLAQYLVEWAPCPVLLVGQQR